MRKLFSRRLFLKYGALLSTLPFFPSNLFGINPKYTRGFQNEDIYHFQVGNFKCICIKDGGHDYPLENFFKNVPKQTVEETLRDLGLPTDHVYTPFTHLIVDTGANKILVDTGFTGNLAKHMKIAGVDPSEIDSVFITHAHPDHVSGILDEDGNIVFTKANYYIWKEEWDFWFSEQANEIADPWHIKVAREKLEPVKDRMIFIEKDSEVFKGTRAIAAHGHTPGHMVVSFSSKKETLFYTGDAVLYPLHLEHPDWLSKYDLVPEKAAITKNKLFNQIAESKALMVAQQFVPFPSLGNVIKKEIGWKFEPVI